MSLDAIHQPAACASAVSPAFEVPAEEALPGRGSISLIVVSAVVDALRQHGAEPFMSAELLAARERVAADPRALMSRRRFLEQLLALRAAMNEPALGLLLGESLTEMSFHFVGPLLASRITLRDAMTTFLTVKRAVLCGAPWAHEQRGDEMVIGHPLERELGRGAELEAELAVTAIYRNVVHWLGYAGRQRVHATFGFPAPRYAAHYRAVFGDNVHFGSPVTGITIPLALFDRERPGASFELAQSVLEFSQRWLPNEPEASFRERVRREFRAVPNLGSLDFEVLASRWGLSLRSLRRRLEAEGTKLSALLDEARLERAQRMLATRHGSLAQIAEQLGYFEVNSFQRAFKRWSGTTPGEFRRRAQRALHAFDAREG